VRTEAPASPIFAIACGVSPRILRGGGRLTVLPSCATAQHPRLRPPSCLATPIATPQTWGLHLGVSCYGLTLLYTVLALLWVCLLAVALVLWHCLVYVVTFALLGPSWCGASTGLISGGSAECTCGQRD